MLIWFQLDPAAGCVPRLIYTGLSLSKSQQSPKTAWGAHFCPESFQHWITYTCPDMETWKALETKAWEAIIHFYSPVSPLCYLWQESHKNLGFPRYPLHHTCGTKELVPQVNQDYDEDLDHDSPE